MLKYLCACSNSENHTTSKMCGNCLQGASLLTQMGGEEGKGKRKGKGKEGENKGGKEEEEEEKRPTCHHLNLPKYE